MTNTINIKELFSDLQKEMVGQLQTNRKHLEHPTLKGDSLEKCFIEWLSKYMPKRYAIDRALVVDSDGNTSEQIDVVIYDQQYSPLVFHREGTIIIPAESVYAVFEVKPEIDKDKIEYASKKIASVRNLKRYTTGVYANNGNNPTPIPPKNIIGGILSIESSWKPPFGDSLVDVLKTLPKEGVIDIGCCADSGSFTVETDNGVYKDLKVSNANDSLIFFFIKLNQLLQVISTVAPINLSKYEKHIN